MTTAEILAELEARNIKVAVVGGRLRVEASPGAAPAWLLAALVEHRAKLLALLELEAGTGESLPTVSPSRAAESGRATSGENCPSITSGEPAQPLGVILPDPGPDRSGVSGSVPGAALRSPPGGTIRIPLDELVYGDFLARNKLRIVDGTAYPDGRTYRPTIYLAGDTG
jgi:hypothetical protein